MAGAVLPDLVDVWFGGARVLHSLTYSVGFLVAVMLGTRGQRLRRRRLLALPIGTFCHLLLDGMWTRTATFWWPFFGWRFDGQGLPSFDRPVVLTVVLEVVGLVALLWCRGRFRARRPGAAPGVRAHRPAGTRPGAGTAAARMSLVLVRHGQTAVNAEGRLQGRIDAPLTDLGRRQAAASGGALSGDVGRVVVSPLLRARQTADGVRPAGVGAGGGRRAVDRARLRRMGRAAAPLDAGRGLGRVARRPLVRAARRRVAGRAGRAGVGGVRGPGGGGARARRSWS